MLCGKVQLFLKSTHADKVSVAMVGGEVVQFCCIEHFFVAKLFNDVIDEESVLQNSVCVLQFRVYVLQNGFAK